MGLKLGLGFELGGGLGFWERDSGDERSVAGGSRSILGFSLGSGRGGVGVKARFTKEETILRERSMEETMLGSIRACREDRSWRWVVWWE